jgi:hypothetical protein
VVFSRITAALLLVLGGLAVLSLCVSACSSKNVCSYNGKEYQEGDTWMDGCQACLCPAAGSKSTYCAPPSPSCLDASADGSPTSAD